MTFILKSEFISGKFYHSPPNTAEGSSPVDFAKTTVSTGSASRSIIFVKAHGKVCFRWDNIRFYLIYSYIVYSDIQCNCIQGYTMYHWPVQNCLELVSGKTLDANQNIRTATQKKKGCSSPIWWRQLLWITYFKAENKISLKQYHVGLDWLFLQVFYYILCTVEAICFWPPCQLWELAICWDGNRI